jgi:hypothetical protein
MTYSERILKVRDNYPFAHWVADWYPLEPEEDDAEPEYAEEYSPENCQEVQDIFDVLLENLVKLGENAANSEKEKAFEIAILKLNAKNESTDFIDTIAREALCDLIDEITVAAGLDPENYSDGDGIADVWREW